MEFQSCHRKRNVLYYKLFDTFVSGRSSSMFFVNITLSTTITDEIANDQTYSYYDYTKNESFSPSSSGM
jgi:hypothetical protein